MFYWPRPISFIVCCCIFASSVASRSASAEDGAKKDHEAAKKDKTAPEARKEFASDTTKEKAMFEAFSADFAKFFSCQKSDSDWYLKRFFEQLKFTLAKHPEIRSISLKPEDIEAMMKKHLKASNPTSDKYLKKISEFSVDVSQELIEARTRQPAPNFDDRLGGARGLLSTLGQTEFRKKWDGTLFTKDMPPTSLRTRLCKTPIKAIDREKANRITVAKAGYPLNSEPTPAPQAAPAYPKQTLDNVDWGKVPKAIPVAEEKPTAPVATPTAKAPKPVAAPKPVDQVPTARPGPVSKNFIQGRIKALDKAIQQANSTQVKAELLLQRKKLQEDLGKAK
jgi:hypothetical protein